MAELPASAAAQGPGGGGPDTPPRLTAWHVIRDNRAYQIFLAGTLLSFAGSTIHVIAASWLIFKLTGAAYAVPLLLLFSVIPGVVLTPVVGTVIDRMDPRILLIVVDVVSMLTVLWIPVAAWLGLLQVWQLYAVETVLAVCGQFYGPASRVFVWRLARRDELLAANATVSLVYQLGIAFGALGGGLLVAVAGPLSGLLLNSASFGVSAVAMVMVGCTRRWIASRSAPRPERAAPPRMWRGLGRIAAEVRHQPRARQMSALYLGLQSAQRLLSGLLVPFIAAAGLGPGTQGALQMSYSIGGVLAGAAIPVLARRVGERALLVLGSAGVAGLMAVFATADVRWLALVLYSGLGFAVSSWVYQLTAAQQMIAPEQLGWYFALMGSLVSLAGVGVYALSSVLLYVLSPQVVYWLGAAALAATALPPVVRLTRRSLDLAARPGAVDDAKLNHGGETIHDSA